MPAHCDRSLEVLCRTKVLNIRSQMHCIGFIRDTCLKYHLLITLKYRIRIERSGDLEPVFNKHSRRSHYVARFSKHQLQFTEFKSPKQMPVWNGPELTSEESGCWDGMEPWQSTAWSYSLSTHAMHPSGLALLNRAGHISALPLTLLLCSLHLSLWLWVLASIPASSPGFWHHNWPLPAPTPAYWSWFSTGAL